MAGEIACASAGVCVCVSGSGNWCRQDPKWQFSCLTEDKREKNIYKQDSKIAGENMERERKGRREGSKEEERKGGKAIAERQEKERGSIV